MAEPGVQALHQRIHQRGNAGRVRARIDDPVPALVVHVDRPGAVAAGRVGLVVAQHHVVHGPDLGRIERGVAGVAHGQHVAQGLPVALDLQERLLVRADRLLTIEGGDRVVLVDQVALDAVRPPDGPGQGRPPQDPFPPPGRAQELPQLLAHQVNLAQDILVLAAQSWS
jgi:hypothetical protein